VSPDLPLLANLSALENVRVIRHFHDRKRDHGLPATMELMARLGIDDAAHLPPSHLKERTAFKVKLLRALMLPNAALGIDRPFSQLHGLFDIAPVLRIIEDIEAYVERCVFFDYKRNSRRYGDHVQ
jgi:ABC-type nitrate/sulfonate/bicarbonate transport system ATPase subunit